jgi:FKBP-type peptidyl-prolyl cis-trans isomerase SlyD
MVIKKIVFLDRDGVLTIPTNIDGKGFAPRSMKEVNFYSDVKSALDILDRNSFKLIVVSNQPDISTGKVNEEFVKMDFNHPLAGIDLHFEVEVLEVREATQDELDHGHVHGEHGVHH